MMRGSLGESIMTLSEGSAGRAEVDERGRGFGDLRVKKAGEKKTEYANKPGLTLALKQVSGIWRQLRNKPKPAPTFEAPRRKNPKGQA